MRTLPLLQQHGCGLSEEGLAAQLARARRLGGDVTRAGSGIAVAFGTDVDAVLVDEFVRTERDCCSFLALDWDEDARVLRIGAEDENGRAVVARLAEAFEEGR